MIARAKGRRVLCRILGSSTCSFPRLAPKIGPQLRPSARPAHYSAYQTGDAVNRRQPQQPPMVLLVQIAQRDRVGEQLVKRISAGAAHVAIVRSPMSEFFGQPAL